MKKKILATLLATAMVASLTACGSTTASESASVATTAAGGSADAEPASLEQAEGSWSPSTTVSIVVPAGAGGNTDLSARVFAEYAKKMTGADFIVVNANGAAGSVAANQVLSSDADGHTFLYGHNLVNVADIAGVTDYNYSAFKIGPSFCVDPAQQLYVNPTKYDSLDAFLEAAKANPGKLQACTEVGAYTYYELLAFQKAAGIELDLVDVGSNSDKITAMLSGQVDLMPGAYINCKDYLESGDFICLGAPTEERYDIIKDIPTFKEQGIDFVYPDCEFSFYFPADTSDEVIGWYENLVETMLQDEAVIAGLANVEMMPNYLSAADTTAREEEIYTEIKAIADSVAQ
ncbi:MAG: tripartite tricarboxylate transporter substrate-binding protein [Lachnospiraceae bacterium]